MKETNHTDAIDTEDLRARIVEAAAALIATGGRDAATTRAVAAAAAVQAPAIYRLFTDKRGLLNAVAEHGMAAYLATKSARAPHPDPVQDLRDGWDMHIEFGLSHPGLFSIMSDDRQADAPSPATLAGMDVLRRRVRHIALAGRLRVSQERAIALLQSVSLGTVLRLLGEPAERRDAGLAAAAREMVMAAICTDPVVPVERGAGTLASALRAHLGDTGVLSAGERHLLEELLDRIANGDERAGVAAGRVAAGPT